LGRVEEIGGPEPLKEEKPKWKRVEDAASQESGICFFGGEGEGEGGRGEGCGMSG